MATSTTAGSSSSSTTNSLTTRGCMNKDTGTRTRTPLVARQIKKAKSVRECLALMPGKPTTDVMLAALQVCGKHNDLNTALKLLRDHEHAESCITLTISIAGKCGDYKTAIKLLDESPTKSIPSYHTCLAACGKAKAWRECLDLYKRLPPSNRHSSTLPGNIVLTAMANAKRGAEALAFFETSMVPYNNHDAQSVLKTMTALIASRDLDAAHTLLQKYAPPDDNKNENDSNPNINSVLLDLLTSAYSKANNWTMVEKLNAQSPSAVASFQPWTVLVKIGKGRSAHWKLGKYVVDSQKKEDGEDNHLIVALQPHRNPSKNGIKLLLLDGGPTKKKIGFLLMKNTSAESTLLGVYLDPKHRQRGLSKIFLALWMQLCLDANIAPATGIMNKPLLCLTLQHTFGYAPPTPPPSTIATEAASTTKSISLSSGAGAAVSVEIAPLISSSPSTGDQNEADEKDLRKMILMYSPDGKSIEGAFSPADKKREGLVFTKTPPEPRGRVIFIKTSLRPPQDLAARVRSILCNDDDNDRGNKFTYDQESLDVKAILCGS